MGPKLWIPININIDIWIYIIWEHTVSKIWCVNSMKPRCLDDEYGSTTMVQLLVFGLTSSSLIFPTWWGRSGMMFWIWELKMLGMDELVIWFIHVFFYQPNHIEGGLYQAKIYTNHQIDHDSQQNKHMNLSGSQQIWIHKTWVDSRHIQLILLEYWDTASLKLPWAHFARNGDILWEWGNCMQLCSWGRDGFVWK